MKELYKVMIARFPGNNSEHPASSEYAANLRMRMEKDPFIEKVESYWVSDTPITMTRNRAVCEAVKRGCDILVMIDSDMAPDVKGHAEKPFWPETFEFMRKRWNFCPTIVAAPYVGPKPTENIYVFRWRNKDYDTMKYAFQLDQYTREEAADRMGVEEVAALPTGLVAIDMRLFTGFEHNGQTIKMKPPWFYYEWTDEYQTDKASTEDVTFTRDANLLFGAAGVGHVCFCNWDSWAIHMKTVPCVKPAVTNDKIVAEHLREAILKTNYTGRVTFINEGLPTMPPPGTELPAMIGNGPTDNNGVPIIMVNHGIKAEHVAALG